MPYKDAIQALADPTRREILERLRQGPQPVGRLAAGLPVSRPAVSQHLKVLEGAGLVSAEREGTRRIYRVEVRGLLELRRYLDSFWGEALEAFRTEAEGAGTESGTGRKTPSRNRRPAPPTRRRHGRNPER